MKKDAFWGRGRRETEGIESAYYCSRLKGSASRIRSGELNRCDRVRRRGFERTKGLEEQNRRTKRKLKTINKSAGRVLQVLLDGQAKIYYKKRRTLASAIAIVSSTLAKSFEINEV
jgi:hypothetical protein